MILYNVAENGALRKAKKMDLVQNRVYLVDDDKVLYLWFGLKASTKKKDFSIKRAKKLLVEKAGKVDLQIINQGKEYGSFLAIMDILKQGISDDSEVLRRPELEMEVEDTLELIDAGLEPDFEAEITLEAHTLAKEGKSYEELCDILAGIQLKMMNPKRKPTQAQIKKKSKEIFKSSSTYDELCWLIAEMNNLLKKK